MSLFDWLRGGPKKTTDELLAEARSLVAAEKFAEAVSVFERVPRRDRTAAVLAETGWAYLEAGNAMAAVACASDARRADAKCAEAACIQGEVLLRERRRGDALERFREALVMNPECEWAKKRLAELDPPRKVEKEPVTHDKSKRMSGTERDETWVRAKLAQMSNAVDALHGKGYYRSAIPLAQDAVRFAKKHLGENNLDTARTLNRLGKLLHATADYTGAKSAYRQALEINQHIFGNDHPDTAAYFNNFGLLLSQMGDYTEARSHLEQAVAISRRVLGNDHPDAARPLNSLGALLCAMCDYAGARPYLEEALEINRRVHGNDHPITAQSLNSIGILLSAIGDNTGAQPYFEQSLEIRRQVLGEDHPNTALSLNNLARLMHALGEFTSARTHYLQYLEKTRKVLGEDHIHYVASLLNFGILSLQMRDYLAARPHLEQALEISRRILGNDHPDRARSLAGLGELLMANADYTGARPYLEQALEVHRRVLGEDHPDTAASLGSLGRLLVAVGEGNEAWRLYQQALAIDDRMIAQVFSVGSERQRATFLRTLQGEFDVFLSLFLRHLDLSPLTPRTVLDTILRRKGLGAEALAAQRDAVLGGRYPHLRDRLTQLSALREQVARATLAGPGSESLDAHRRKLAGWTTEKERLESELAGQVPEMNLERNLRAADRRAIALGLDAGVALVEFVRFHEFAFHAVPARGESQWKPARYLAFVLPGGDPDAVTLIDLGEAEPIDRLIADFRASVAVDPDDRQNRNMVRRRHPLTDASDGSALRAAVFDPLRSSLGGRTRLLVSPDGQLAQLPFAALPTADGRLLADGYLISYVGTGRDALRFTAPAATRSEAALVMCDPDFDLGSATARLASLPAGRTSRDLHSGLGGVQRLLNTLEEGRVIGELLHTAPWHGEQALKKPFLAACVSPRILHLATHGFFLEDQRTDLDRELWGRMLDDDGHLRGDVGENPLLRSGLVLAGANTFLRGNPLPEEADTGLLTSLDVTGLDLLGTELVVLSACETGLGDVQVGEGVIGLQRAFTIAGARTLVMSLWSVDDKATCELMVSFYRRLLAGEGKADALRHAQDELRAKPEYADPYYWAAFVLLGDPGPLREPLKP